MSADSDKGLILWFGGCLVRLAIVLVAGLILIPGAFVLASLFGE